MKDAYIRNQNYKDWILEKLEKLTADQQKRIYLLMLGMSGIETGGHRHE